MRKKKLVTAAITLFIFLIGSAFTSIGYATEKDEKHHRGKHSEAMMGKASHIGYQAHHRSKGKQHRFVGYILTRRDELGLTDEQVSQLESLKSENKKQQIRDEADMKVLKIELHDLLRQDKVDSNAVDAKIEKIGTLFTTMKKNHIYAKLDAKKMLTEEQMEKFKEHGGSERYQHRVKEEAPYRHMRRK